MFAIQVPNVIAGFYVPTWVSVWWLSEDCQATRLTDRQVITYFITIVFYERLSNIITIVAQVDHNR